MISRSCHLHAFLLAAGMALTQFSPASAGTLKLGMTTWVGYGPLYLARDLGYFKEGNLDVELQTIEEAALYMAAMAAGQLQGTASTVDETMKYRSSDFCFKSVYALDDSHGGDGVLTGKDANGLSDLKGKDVGINEGSTSQFWFNILLKNANMTQDDVKIVNMTADDAAAAFMADRIPVAVTWEPHLTFAKKAGKGKVLVTSATTPGVIVDTITLRCDVIEKQADDVRALVRGLNKANDFIKKDPDQAYAIMAKGVGGYLSDPKDFAASAAGVDYYGKDRNQQFLSGGDTGQVGQLIKLGGEVWGKLGKLKMNLTYKELVDPSFIEK